MRLTGMRRCSSRIWRRKSVIKQEFTSNAITGEQRLVMKILHRYLLLQYFRVFVMVFCSLLGIFVVADFVGNLSEFVDSAKSSGSLASVLGKYYGARIPWFFDLAGRNVALLSAALTLAWLQRDSELTALMAAGIPRWRVARPLVIASLVIAGLATINRELWVPAFRTQLCRNAQDLLHNRPEKLDPKLDPSTGIFFKGESILHHEQQILKPTFLLASEWPGVGRKLIANTATFLAENEQHPRGYLLEDVQSVSGFAAVQPYSIRQRDVAWGPAEQPWMQAGQVFVATNVTIDQLRRGRQWHQCTATLPLIRGLRAGDIDHANVRVMVHSRFVQPLLDMTLIFLGLPFVFDNGRTRAVILQSAKSIVAIVGFGLVVLVCNGLGVQGIISPALAAWAPLFVLVPIAFLVSEPLRR